MEEQEEERHRRATLVSLNDSRGIARACKESGWTYHFAGFVLDDLSAGRIEPLAQGDKVRISSSGFRVPASVRTYHRNQKRSGECAA